MASHKMPERLKAIYDEVMPIIKGQLIIGATTETITEVLKQSHNISDYRTKEWIIKAEYALKYPEQGDDEDGDA